MCLIGMLHYRNHPEDAKKAYPFAAVAKMEGIEFFYFSYGKVHFEKKKIFGWVYQSGQWVEREMNFPDCIINISKPKTGKQIETYARLKEIIPFTSRSVGNKMKVYKKILKGKRFVDYLIPSFHLQNSTDLFPYLKQYQKIVLKPFSGHHGNHILFIELLNEEQLKLINGVEEKILSPQDLLQFIDPIINSNSFLLQPFIECKTKAGLAYDFRIHVQKNGKDDWAIALIYPRISGDHKLTSNIRSGGYRRELLPFLIEQFGVDYLLIKHSLEHFALSFAPYFEGLYSYAFDELGIDVAIDRHQKLWIYEVNWRPGSKHREFEVAKRLIPYAVHLAQKAAALRKGNDDGREKSDTLYMSSFTRS